jgi:hypothetical protein
LDFEEKPTPPPVRVTKAVAASICKCGGHIDIGHASVRIGGMDVHVSITATGVKWPHGVALAPEIAAEIEPVIRAEWIASVTARWEGKR